VLHNVPSVLHTVYTDTKVLTQYNNIRTLDSYGKKDISASFRVLISKKINCMYNKTMLYVFLCVPQVHTGYQQMLPNLHAKTQHNNSGGLTEFYSSIVMLIL